MREAVVSMLRISQRFRHWWWPRPTNKVHSVYERRAYWRAQHQKNLTLQSSKNMTTADKPLTGSVSLDG